MDTAEYFVVATLCCIAFGVFYKGVRYMRTAALIRNIPTSKIRSMAVGLVKISGTVIDRTDSITSPFTHTPCLFWCYRVEQQQDSRENRTTWRVVAQNISNGGFYIEDDTGSVPIFPHNAYIQIPYNYVGADVSDLVAGLEKIGNPHHLNFRNREYRIYECVICSGDQLCIVGNASENTHRTASQQIGSDRLCITHKGAAPLVIAADSDSIMVEKMNKSMYIYFAIALVFCVIAGFFVRQFS